MMVISTNRHDPLWEVVLVLLGEVVLVKAVLELLLVADLSVVFEKGGGVLDFFKSVASFLEWSELGLAFFLGVVFGSRQTSQNFLSSSLIVSQFEHLQLIERPYFLAAIFNPFPRKRETGFLSSVVSAADAGLGSGAGAVFGIASILEVILSNAFDTFEKVLLSPAKGFSLKESLKENFSFGSSEEGALSAGFESFLGVE